MVGLCTGSLAAAAVCCSRNIAELLPAAIEAVLVAFRTGLRATEVRDRLELSDGASATWSIVVPGIQEGAASTLLKDFCHNRVCQYELVQNLGLTPPDYSLFFPTLHQLCQLEKLDY